MLKKIFKSYIWFPIWAVQYLGCMTSDKEPSLSELWFFLYSLSIQPYLKKTEMQYHLISQWFSGSAMRSPEDEREESEIKSVPSTQISLFHVQGFFPYSLPWGPETTPSPLTFWAEELQQLHD